MKRLFKKLFDKTFLIYVALGFLNYGFCSAVMLFFKHELAAGTPFTFPGAKELIRLGICTVCISVGTSALAAIVYQIMALFFENVREMSFGGISSVGLGVMFIFTGLLCRYGAEVTAEKNQKEEKS